MFSLITSSLMNFPVFVEITKTLKLLPESLLSPPYPLVLTNKQGRAQCLRGPVETNYRPLAELTAHRYLKKT